MPDNILVCVISKVCFIRVAVIPLPHSDITVHGINIGSKGLMPAQIMRSL